jgi:glucose/arabinose dehydrogenase
MQVGEQWTDATVDRLRLNARVLAVGLEDAVDLALAPDGRLLIAERSGSIRLVRDEVLDEQPIGTISDLATGEGRGLLALAVGRGPDNTQSVYVVYTTASGARLARFTLHEDALAEHATLLEELPVSSSNPAAALRIGPDLKLYLALDNAGDAGRADDFGSYAGKVLRLNLDGTTPDDLAGTSPVFAAGIHRPAGVAWQSGASSMWVAAQDAGGIDWVYEVRSDERTSRPAVVGQHPLPEGTGARDLAIFQVPGVPELQGNLLVAAEDGRSILRLRPQDGGGFTIEPLFAHQLGGMRAVVVNPDGTLYALMGNALTAITVTPAEG